MKTMKAHCWSAHSGLIIRVVRVRHLLLAATLEASEQSHAVGSVWCVVGGSQRQVRTLMEPGSCTGPPAFCWATKEATPKEVSGAAWKNFACCAFHAPFSASGLCKHAFTLSGRDRLTLGVTQGSIDSASKVP